MGKGKGGLAKLFGGGMPEMPEGADPSGAPPGMPGVPPGMPPGGLPGLPGMGGGGLPRGLPGLPGKKKSGVHAARQTQRALRFDVASTGVYTGKRKGQHVGH